MVLTMMVGATGRSGRNVIELEVCLITFLFASGTYLVWPSRWNIHAHTQLGFWFVSSVVPIYFVGVLKHAPNPAIVHEYAHVMLVGSIWYCVFMIIGAALRTRGQRLGIFQRVAMAEYRSEDSATRRTKFAVLAGIAVLTFALMRMGFVPMFAKDPLMAKFFRGRYAALYAPVAFYFRLGTSVLSLLIPAAVAYAVTSERRSTWRLLALSSVGLMVITLQRGLALSGLVIFLGVWLVRRRRTALFLVLAFVLYVGGALFYALLTKLGILSVNAGADPLSFWASVASSVPDISDALSFLPQWHQAGAPLTHGRTFYGGIVPSHYAWNPAVWTLTLGNPNADLNAIGSGGLRLPAPIWGLVSLGGTSGVAFVCAASGLFTGWLTRAARDGMESADTLMAQIWVTVLYFATMTILPVFYSVTYIAIVQFAVVYWILNKALGAVLSKRGLDVVQPPPSSRRAGSGTRSPSSRRKARTVGSSL